MRNLIPLCLISLLSFGSFAQQRFDVAAEIALTGKKMIARHAAKADTCIPKTELLAAKTYVDALEDRYAKTLQDNALLRLQVGQRAQRIEAISEDNTRLTGENSGLKTALEDSEKNRKVGGWVSAALGAAGTALIIFISGAH